MPGGRTAVYNARDYMLDLIDAIACGDLDPNDSEFARQREVGVATVQSARNDAIRRGWLVREQRGAKVRLRIPGLSLRIRHLPEFD